MYRMGIDVGGTFTDVILLDSDSGRYFTYKLSSSLRDQSEAIVQGAREILDLYHIDVGQVAYFGHGTTVATNMIIERKGARTALLTTKGFRDLLEIGRQVRPSLYAIDEDKPESLICRRLRLEVDERTLFDGSILKEADEEEIISILLELRRAGVESVAVCFLFSFLNPENERVVERCLRQVWPEAYYSLSSTILPEFREFERLSTTVINSYLGPRMKLYINNLRTRIKELGIIPEPYITQSSGGVMSIGATIQTPIQTALSGPSAGVMGAIHVAGGAGFTDLITYDMGGTSTDVSLVRGGCAEYTTKRKVCGLPSGVPMIDVHAVGAGGGSIARIDNAGALKVGPDSAGADPGPAAYGLGNEEPVVTDANLVLGRINPCYVLGGRLQLQADLSREAVRRKLALPLGMTVEQAALGVLSVVNANMARAIRVITVEKGFDPSDFVLVAYGGAGPLHAVFLAREMGVRTVLVPPAPGVLCALGLLTADIKKSYVRTAMMLLDAADPERIGMLLSEMIQEGRQWLSGEKVDPGEQSFRLLAEMRYVGQNYELQVPLPFAHLTAAELDQARQDFFQAHKQNYGYYNPKAPVQFVNFRCEAVGRTIKPQAPLLEEIMANPETALLEVTPVYFEETGWVECPVYDRSRFGVCPRIDGPAIIQQMDSTSVLPPGAYLRVDAYGNLIISAFGE